MAAAKKAQLLEQIQELQRWRDAVEEAAQSAGLGALQPGTSPVLAMDWIIATHLEVAQLERVQPLSEWQITQLELGRLSDAITTVRKVERALGVVEPGEELRRVGVPVQVPDAARELLQASAAQRHPGAPDAAQLLWDELLRASGAIEPIMPPGRPAYDWIKARPTITRDPTRPKIQITAEMLREDDHDAALN